MTWQQHIVKHVTCTSLACFVCDSHELYVSLCHPVACLVRIAAAVFVVYVSYMILRSFCRLIERWTFMMSLVIVTLVIDAGETTEAEGTVTNDAGST